MASPQTARRGTGSRYTEGQVEAAVVNYNRLAAAFLNRAIPQGALLPVVATATTVQQAKLTNPVDYCVDGKWFTKAATDNLWTFTGAANTGTDSQGSQSQVYLLLLDSVGTASVFTTATLGGFTITRGLSNPTAAQALQAVTDQGRWGLGLALGAALPWDGKAIIGYFVQSTNSTNGWTPGTTSTATGGGYVNTFFDGVPVQLIQQIANEAAIVASSNLY